MINDDDDVHNDDDNEENIHFPNPSIRWLLLVLLWTLNPPSFPPSSSEKGELNENQVDEHGKRLEMTITNGDEIHDGLTKMTKWKISKNCCLFLVMMTFAMLMMAAWAMAAWRFERGVTRLAGPQSFFFIDRDSMLIMITREIWTVSMIDYN